MLVCNSDTYLHRHARFALFGYDMSHDQTVRVVRIGEHQLPINLRHQQALIASHVQNQRALTGDLPGGWPATINHNAIQALPRVIQDPVA
ncbi:hypothetical protein SRM1_00673 [Pseudomonas fluorescens]|nr:hypothetical protein SRM1_00673 [Pseudomonas fluorescens]